jgi:phosphinothricin tripeptide acetyl hydrolase
VLAERARKAGVDATLEVWPEMIHVWHWFFPMLDEGQAAIDRIGAFVRARTR